MKRLSKARRATNIIQQKKANSNHIKVPKPIRDELQMTCALQGFSAMRQSGQKTLAKQGEFMNDFFHGVDGKGPSQLKMLAEGVGVYKDLYETTMNQVVGKKGKAGKKGIKTKHLRLKPELTRVDGVHYYAGSEITQSDLERKNRNRGGALINGRSIQTMASNGACEYRKAYAYACDKWDMKKMRQKNLE
jgi:hypothetical protein